ncbi:thioredoxin domain-containing protein [Parapontixanthobacter aurantiacus]|nr:thioredoxin domain-containing protein [Parapontixanthobacter aurantiacus]
MTSMLLKKGALAFAALALGLGASPAIAQMQGLAAARTTEAGHSVGNEEAPVSLIAFISYTCPACANFTRQSEGAMQIGYIGQNQVTLEYRPMIHNPVDLVATMLVECGSDDRFYKNHMNVYSRQGEWLQTLRNAPQSQIALWSQGNTSANARRSIASGLGFYEMFESAGYRRTDLDACLSDQMRADALIAQAQKNYTEFGLPSTPSFAIDGEPQPGIHSWQQLQPLIEAAILDTDEPADLDEPSVFAD